MDLLKTIDTTELTNIQTTANKSWGGNNGRMIIDKTEAGPDILQQSVRLEMTAF